MVVSFSRASFKLDAHMVSVSLLAMFGGYAQGFRVCFLRNRSYKFSVASKSARFEIYNAGKIVEKEFEMVFSLWNFDGPNWIREERAYYAELVGRNGRAVDPHSGDRRSYNLVV